MSAHSRCTINACRVTVDGKGGDISAPGQTADRYSPETGGMSIAGLPWRSGRHPQTKVSGLRAGPQRGWKLHTVGWFCGTATPIWLDSLQWLAPRTGRGRKAGEAGLERWCPLQAALPIRWVLTP